jgi:hypothetical protein
MAFHIFRLITTRRAPYPVIAHRGRTLAIIEVAAENIHISPVRTVAPNVDSQLASFEHFEEILPVLRNRAKNSIHVLLVNNRAVARALGFSLKLRAQIIHIRLAILNSLRALDAIPGLRKQLKTSVSRSRNLPKHVAGEELLRVLAGNYLRFLAGLLILDFFHQIALLRQVRLQRRDVGLAEIVDGEGILEESAKIGVHDAILWVPIIAKQDGIERSTVLIGEPVQSLVVLERRVRLLRAARGGGWRLIRLGHRGRHGVFRVATGLGEFLTESVVRDARLAAMTVRTNRTDRRLASFTLLRGLGGVFGSGDAGGGEAIVGGRVGRVGVDIRISLLATLGACTRARWTLALLVIEVDVVIFTGTVDASKDRGAKESVELVHVGGREGRGGVSGEIIWCH